MSFPILLIVKWQSDTVKIIYSCSSSFFFVLYSRQSLGQFRLLFFPYFKWISCAPCPLITFCYLRIEKHYVTIRDFGTFEYTSEIRFTTLKRDVQRAKQMAVERDKFQAIWLMYKCLLSKHCQCVSSRSRCVLSGMEMMLVNVFLIDQVWTQLRSLLVVASEEWKQSLGQSGSSN